MPPQDRDAASPPSDPLRALLAAYAEALALARDLPLFVRRWFRPFVRLLLVNHIARRVAALRREALAQAAQADDPTGWKADGDPPRKEARPDALSSIGAAWIALYAALVALLLPSSSYRLKQVLVSVAPRRREVLERDNLAAAGVWITWHARAKLEGAVPGGLWRKPVEIGITAGMLIPVTVNALLVYVLLSSPLLH